MIAHLLAGILAAEGSGTAVLLALGPAGGVGVYVALYRFYRNTDKSHGFEHETRVVAQPITGHEQKVDEIKGTKRTSIDGDNGSNHRQRVQRVDSI